ncbi:uncharacterized protein APUU_71067S [Aspergillus puulaauensis]|uniref:GPI anchored protein n=1 Tax=Aspergillus puulaauensis TaxID=1220207 RepID=A0A7R7XXE8_9EURO|nr:uncharacterized protein APUU_71067S [Aspergillus puulaauensis]BCS29497.1 hypothetical protein APUU_71067S [Aspergillus puulaauensis]
MHLLLTSLLALTSLQLATATGSARVTQAPAIPKVFRRQDYICPTGENTVCADGFGCCERGAPCTTIRGEAACDTGECNGLPCGHAGLCCDATCTSSRGTAICVHGSESTTTDDYAHSTVSTGLGDWDVTTTSMPSPTKLDPDSDIDAGGESITSTSDETSERPTRPTYTATSSGSDNGDDSGSGSGSGSDTMTTPTLTQTVLPNGEPFPTPSNDDTGGRSGGGSGDGGGAGMVSPQAFVVLGLVLVGGLFLVR